MQNARRVAIGIFALLGIAFYYNYHHILFQKPQSIHKWRQSDCASIALNYYQGGMHFMQPQTHNLTSDKGTTGKCCTSEMPILYYGVACLYTIFGYHDFIYRGLNTVLFLLGLFYLFRLFYQVSKNLFWSVLLSLLMFTSPVLVYYGNNYLSNTPALAFSIIGWFYFMRFVQAGNQRDVFLSVFIFMVAAAFKVTAFFSLFAILGIFTLELLGLSIIPVQNTAKRSWMYIVAILAAISVVVAWIVYASIFNRSHDCYYFSTTIFPIWSLDKQGVKNVVEIVKNVWLYQYFHKSIYALLLLCFIFLIIKRKKANKLLIISILIVMIELVAYVALQFWTFKDHDYYTIDMFIAPVLVWVACVELLQRCYSNILGSVWVKSILAILLIYNIHYANQKLKERYCSPVNDYEETKDWHTIPPYLKQLGISPNDTAISIPDGSHASLYLMNLKGWTEYTDTRFNKTQEVRYNQDSASIQSSIQKGARYLIINGLKEFYLKPYLRSYCHDLVGQYNHVFIFDLKSSKVNYQIPQREVLQTYFCDAEELSKNKESFRSRNSDSLFQNGSTRSSEFYFQGHYSSKLSEKSPFGMTCQLKGFKNGESLKISVWRKRIGTSYGDLIASTENTGEFYNNKYRVIKSNATGWEQIEMEFFITAQLENKPLVVYIYNPGKDPVYFDNLEIVTYKNVLN